MKPTVKSLLFALAFAGAAIACEAAAPPGSVEIDGTTYRINPEVTGTAIVESHDKGTPKAHIPETVEIDGSKYVVTTIGDHAFSGCYGVDVSLPKTITTIEEYAFESGSSKIELHEGLETIRAHAYVNVGDEVVLPNSLIELGWWPFQSRVSKVTVKNLRSYCGIRCSGGSFAEGCSFYLNDNEVRNLVIPEMIEEVKDNLFRNCGSIISVNTSDARTIGSYSFAKCLNLKEVDLGKHVTSIGEKSFADCKSLETVNCHASVPPSADASSFENSYPEYMTLHVPYGCAEAYKKHEVWGLFGKIVESFESGIGEISCDDSNVPAEYYTVQGVRTDKPEKGNVYIRKQGENVTKVIL